MTRAHDVKSVVVAIVAVGAGGVVAFSLGVGLWPPQPGAFLWTQSNRDSQQISQQIFCQTAERLAVIPGMSSWDEDGGPVEEEMAPVQCQVRPLLARPPAGRELLRACDAHSW